MRIPDDVDTDGIVARPRVLFEAPDPRLYSADQHQITVPLFAASGGLNYPVDYPKEFVAGRAPSAVATNAGASDAYPLVRFYGPTDGGTVTAVLLRNLTTGEVVEIEAAIATGQILTFDPTTFVTASGAQVVGLDGSSRYGSWQHPRVPLRLPPGDSVLRFETVGTSSKVRCVVTWRDTWLT